MKEASDEIGAVITASRKAEHSGGARHRAVPERVPAGKLLTRLLGWREKVMILAPCNSVESVCITKAPEGAEKSSMDTPTKCGGCSRSTGTRNSAVWLPSTTPRWSWRGLGASAPAMPTLSLACGFVLVSFPLRRSSLTISCNSTNWTGVEVVLNQQNSDGSQVNKGGKRSVQLIISGSDFAKAFELLEEALNQMTLFI